MTSTPTRRASIFRKPKSEFWYAAFRDAAGRRVQRTTKCTDEGEARRMALAWADVAAQGRQGLLTEDRCRKVLSELHEQATGAPLTFYTVQSWLAEWIEERAGTIAGITLSRYKSTVREFLAFLGDRAAKPLPTVSHADMRRFRDKLHAEGHSPANCHQLLRILSIPFKLACARGRIPVNPTLGIPKLKDDRTDKRIPFTIEQIRGLLKVTKGTDWEGVIMLGAFCGLRLQDAANLTFGAINFQTGMLSLKTAKRGVQVDVPLQPALLAYLRARPPGVGKAPLFPTLCGNKANLSMGFKRRMAHAGIVGKVAREGTGKGRTISTLSFHSTRYFFVSSLSAAGVPEDTRKRLAGHVDSKTHASYAAGEIESLRAAMAKMPAIGGGK